MDSTCCGVLHGPVLLVRRHWPDTGTRQILLCLFDNAWNAIIQRMHNGEENPSPEEPVAIIIRPTIRFC